MQTYHYSTVAMKIFDEDTLARAYLRCNVATPGRATIGETLLVADHLEKTTGIPVIRMDQGSPSLQACKVGIEAEKRALDAGVASSYPAAAGVPCLKSAASKFIKAFIDIDIDPKGCIPTTGSVEASFGAFIAATQRIPGKDKILFIDPGFPIQKSQLKILSVPWRSIDIYEYRGKDKLKAHIARELSRGDIAAIVYSNPNNPSWICLEEEELQVIGELATEYDAIVIEDLAYFCMDYRKNLGKPFRAPFLPSVARYTDNYILLLSASKIFSYAGQRIALACIGDNLFRRQYPALSKRYDDLGIFGETLVASILYMITSGCTASTQYAYADMLEKSCEGVIDFVQDTREYERRARRMKEIFTGHGFNVVYDRDVSSLIGDGFFFTLGYNDMDSDILTQELMAYGISSINIKTTGSLQNGVRACCAKVPPEQFALLEERAAEFEKDHTSL